MSTRLGILGVAHVHTPSYTHCAKALPGVEVVGVWDVDPARAETFAQAHGTQAFVEADELLAQVDAAVICAENVRHRDHAERAFAHKRHVLCEKPLATTVEDAEAMVRGASAAGVVLMTAFPCPFSPAFAALKKRVDDGEIGKVLSICSTNRGSCPGGWFIEPELSGGGAMIDHTVHVADLLKRLLGEEPNSVFAQIGSNMYGQAWDDTAMVSLAYPSGVFATLDSSWSRPGAYKTWGDVTMTVVGEKGMIELDMFNPSFDVYRPGTKTHTLGGYGSNLDLAMVAEFVRAVQSGGRPQVTGEDGLAAAKVAVAAYASTKQGQAVAP